MLNVSINNSLRATNLFPLQVLSFLSISVSLCAVFHCHELEKCRRFISEISILKYYRFIEGNIYRFGEKLRVFTQETTNTFTSLPSLEHVV